MLSSFFQSKEHRLFAWGVLLLLLVMSSTQVYMTVLFNEWYGGFYNSLESKNYDQFISSLFRFSWLAAIYILLAAFNVYIAQHYCLRWRRAVTFAYLPLWMANDRYIEGASQRIQEDVMRGATMVYKMGLGLFKAVLTLIAFIPILWTISANISIFGHTIAGALVWVALASSLGGLLISMWVGRRLPYLEYENQKTEALFRKLLVYGEDDRSKVTGEETSLRFADIVQNYRSLYDAFKWFSLWENTYLQASILIPYIVGAPSFFAGLVTLGTLAQIANSFEKVHESFSFFIVNWTNVAELRSVILRLREFEDVINHS
jgi:peptide/bleomycin uptake transporter